MEEINHLVASQGTAASAVRLEALLPIDSDPSYITDPLDRISASISLVVAFVCGTYSNGYNVSINQSFTQSNRFLARDSICYSALYAIARPSVRLSITRVDQSKTAKVRITQPSPQSSPMTLVS